MLTSILALGNIVVPVPNILGGSLTCTGISLFSYNYRKGLQPLTGLLKYKSATPVKSNHAQLLVTKNYFANNLSYNNYRQPPAGLRAAAGVVTQTIHPAPLLQADFGTQTFLRFHISFRLLVAVRAAYHLQ